MPSAASMINHGQQRKREYGKNKIKGSERSLNRGIHVDKNNRAVQQWARKNPNAKQKDPKELMVHHQKIDHELKDVYSRTAALVKDNMTMEERKEQAWKDFEMIGGKRPKEKVKFREHLETLRQTKKDMRDRAAVEFGEKGEFTDYGRQGSALHDMKDKRIKKFVKGQLDRAHTLKRFGDPTPLKQSGNFDRHENTFSMHKKTLRGIKRGVKHEEKLGQVKERKKGSKSMWELGDSGKGINQRSGVVNNSRDTGLDVGRQFSRRKRNRD